MHGIANNWLDAKLRGDGRHVHVDAIPLKEKGSTPVGTSKVKGSRSSGSAQNKFASTNKIPELPIKGRPLSVQVMVRHVSSS